MKAIEEESVKSNLANEIEYYEYHHKHIFKMFFCTNLLERYPNINLEVLSELKKSLKYQHKKIQMLSILENLIKENKTFDDYNFLTKFVGDGEIWQLKLSVERCDNET